MIHLQNEEMASHSTFKIGGIAKDVYLPESLEEFREIYSEDFAVIGNGSNILFCDGIIKTPIIITTKMNGFHFDGEKIAAECGALVISLAHEAAKRGLSGLEFAGGIPGTVGGCIYMNAGAHGGQISNVVVSSQLLVVSDEQIDDGQVVTFNKEQHEFGYRKSVFQDTGDIILQTTLELEEGSSEEITRKMKDNLAKRKASQPMDFPSAGSVFKKAGNISAGEFIDKCGLKGKTIGGAQISSKHAGFIVNIGGATAQDVLDLIEFVKADVLKQQGIALEEEVRIIK